MAHLHRKPINIEFKPEIFNPDFMPYYKDRNRFLVFYGGAGSGKSYFAAQKILIRILTEKNHRVLLVRKVGRTIRNSQFQLFKDLIYGYNLGHLFNTNDSTLEIKCHITGSLIFSAGLDDVEKLKSIQRVTMIWLEEATEIKGEAFEQLNLRLRGKLPYYKQIILSFNPIDENNYFVKRFVFGKERNVTVMHSTYKNNARFIDEEYGDELESLKDRDKNLYLIYAKGIPGIIKNLVLKPFTMLSDYDEIHPDRSFYGLDFGFNNPSALVKVHVHDKYNLYTEELLYRTHLTNQQLIEQLKIIINPIDVALGVPIYADPAEPARIQEISDAGFNCIPANNAFAGIDFLRQCNIHSLMKNDNLNKERQSYKYAEDKDGNVSDKEVVKFYDHLMDGVRYAGYTDYRNHMVGDTAEAM